MQLQALVANTSYREPSLLQQIDVNLLAIKSKFQFFKLTSGKKVLVSEKVNMNMTYFRFWISHAVPLTYDVKKQLSFVCNDVGNRMTS